MLRVLLALIVCCCPLHAEDKKDKAEPKKLNRLAKESSPYLLQHAHNPVEWYPWGPEAFEKAKKENKIVLLSVGYSSCHWCHVMEKESFATDEVAAILNKNFICIKVDREERPDIDEIYMTAVQTMGLGGGWPLNVFMLPDARPFFGGTYWPKDDKDVDGKKVTGFKSILKLIHEIHTDKPKELLEQAEKVAASTEAALTAMTRVNPLVELKRELASEALESYREDLDPKHGGIGSKKRQFRGTKFPRATAMIYLYEGSLREDDQEIHKLTLLGLDRMAEGGLFDHLGGGFHRYSTERTWTVPHFEKMLYDQGQLLELYSLAYAKTSSPLYKTAIAKTVEFLQREMTDPKGAFYSALDADSEGEEGVFYVWTKDQLKKALEGVSADDATLFREVYSLDGDPNFEGKSYILRLSQPWDLIARTRKMKIEEIQNKLEPIRKKLFELRAKRERPFLDKKILTSWNGQMIAGLAAASVALKEPKYAEIAAKAADFLLKNLRNDKGRLLRTCIIDDKGAVQAKLNAYLDDYAYLVHGLLNLYEATKDEKWLKESKMLTDVMIQAHGDDKGGGYYFTSSDHEKLFVRNKDYNDGAQPSANGAAARNLVRLHVFTKDEKYLKEVDKSLRQFAGAMKSSPEGTLGLAMALHGFLDLKKKK